ncbi:hypothetical protein [Haliangium sp.]|uniref:hypothetical protein n=1 Tax=Haliangium sp. TaxID=2663208 RepID=UPI003D09D727
MQLGLEIVPPDPGRSLGGLLQAFRQYSRAHQVRISGHLHQVSYGDESGDLAGPLAEVEVRASECVAWHAKSHHIADRRVAPSLYAEWMNRLAIPRYRLIVDDSISDSEEFVSSLRDELGLAVETVRVPVDIPPKEELSRRPEMAVRRFLEWAQHASHSYHCADFAANQLADVIGAVVLGRHDDVVITDAVTSPTANVIRRIADFVSDDDRYPEVTPALDYLLEGGMIAKVLIEAGRLTVGLSLATSRRVEARLSAPMESE